MDEEIDSTIICLMQNENNIYDKTNSVYHIKDYKQQSFEVISQALFQILEINISPENVAERWQKLYKKFLTEHSKLKKHIQSGSAPNKTSQWPLYECMSYLIPYTTHQDDIIDSFDYTDENDVGGSSCQSKHDEPQRSLDKVSSTQSKLNGPSRNCKRQNIDMAIDQSLETISKSVAQVTNSIKDTDETNKKTVSDARLQIIMKDFNNIDEERQTNCMIEILQVITQYKSNN